MAFKVTKHYPAHDPEIAELDAMAAQGWFIISALVGPPESAHAVPPLVIIWKYWGELPADESARRDRLAAIMPHPELATGRDFWIFLGCMAVAVALAAWIAFSHAP